MYHWGTASRSITRTARRITMHDFPGHQEVFTSHKGDSFRLPSPDVSEPDRVSSVDQHSVDARLHHERFRCRLFPVRSLQRRSGPADGTSSRECEAFHVLGAIFQTQYSRLGGRYGECITSVDQVKSYYGGTSYTADVCFRFYAILGLPQFLLPRCDFRCVRLHGSTISGS